MSTGMERFSDDRDAPSTVEPITVDLWVLDLDDPDRLVDTSERVLSAPERARARALTAEPHARRYASSKVQLRQLLATYLAVEPAAVQFAAEALGKPVLVAGSSGLVRFNTSRSAGTGLVAVQQDGIDVGVDVEAIRPGFDLAAVADRFFPADELGRVAAMPRQERARARYDCWTRIEAELKGIGSGLAAREQPAAGREDDVDEEPTRSTGRRPDWSVRNVAIAPAMSAAIAVHVGAGRSVRTELRRWAGNRP